MSMLVDENFPAEIYVEPNDREFIDKDFGDEGGEELLNNLCGNQLNAPAKLALSGDRIDAIDFVESASSLEVEQANKVHKDQHKN